MKYLLSFVIALAVPGLSLAQTAPYQGAPLCASHDNRAWHSLWNAEQGCHYDHQHGDNPRALDDLFGTSLFDLMGGTISHPWQTFSDAGVENDLKHAGYFWHVKRDLPCPQATVSAPGCLTAFRLLVHQHPSGRDVPVRFHSATFEGQVRNVATGAIGYIQIPGMWVDFGHLVFNGSLALGIDVGASAEPGRHRQHSSGGTNGIWYGATKATHVADAQGRIARGFLSISTSVHDLWDSTEAHDFGNFLDYACTRQFGISPTDTRCRSNGTQLRPHLIVVNGHAGRLALPVVDPDGNRIINWTGYFDRYGVPQQAGVCGTASLDCVPVSIQNVSVDVNYVCEQVCGQLFTDHDIYFGNRTAGWSSPRP
jgi:hypothetical protein